LQTIISEYIAKIRVEMEELVALKSKAYSPLIVVLSPGSEFLYFENGNTGGPAGSSVGVVGVNPASGALSNFQNAINVVEWKPKEVTIYASTQGTSSVPDEFADVFTLPKSKVRVITC
jgi:hypothetical protein